MRIGDKHTLKIVFVIQDAMLFITCVNLIGSKFDNAISIKQVCHGKDEAFEIKPLIYSKN